MGIYSVRTSFLLALFVLLLAIGSFAQANEQTNNTVSSAAPPAAQAPGALEPVIKDVEGITIGMTSDDVKAKLGRPETSDDSGMLFSRDNGETVQISLDADGKVRMIAAVYSGKKAGAPEITAVFGQNGDTPASAEGKIYKMVRYPSAGYWVAYSRLNLDSGPMTTVTIQKIRTPK